MANLLLLHGTIITLDGERRIIDDGGLAIEDDKIVDIGTPEELRKRHPTMKIKDCRKAGHSWPH